MVSPEIKSLVLVGSGGFDFQRLHLHGGGCLPTWMLVNHECACCHPQKNAG